jgi:hypothetical protein
LFRPNDLNQIIYALRVGIDVCLCYALISEHAAVQPAASSYRKTK